MSVLDRANKMQQSGAMVHHLEVGQPGTGAPPGAIEALRRATEDGDVMGYTSTFGHWALPVSYTHLTLPTIA